LKECTELIKEKNQVTMYSLVQFETDHSFRDAVK